MNILTDTLPTSIEIDGRAWEINTDFRDCLRIILALEDDELIEQEKQFVLLSVLYKEIPSNTAQALVQGSRFLNGGKAVSKVRTYRYYSMDKDAGFVFSAFKQTHDIDLEQIEYLHFWKFLAYFMDLGSNTMVKTGKASKEERKLALELGDMFVVPEFQSVEDIEEERLFLEKVGNYARV